MNAACMEVKSADVEFQDMLYLYELF